MTLTLEALIETVAQSSDEQRARALVTEACSDLGIRFPPTGPALVLVVNAMAQRSGAVGASIRLARRRAERARFDDRSTTTTGVDAPKLNGAAVPPAKTEPRLEALLAPALGDEKAKEVVRTACQQMGLEPLTLTAAQERRILDHLSTGGDYVATVARFAKVKALLGK